MEELTKYKNGFLDLITECERNVQYVGLGNPNAKLLLVGKEAGLERSSELFHGMPCSWRDRKYDYSDRYCPEDSRIRKGNHTWQRYQMLYEIILHKLEITDVEPKMKPGDITFVENVFTTELSNIHASTTMEAKNTKDFHTELDRRKREFWGSEFIQQFPVVVICALDNRYIETYKGEVCKLFNVVCEDFHVTSNKERMWIHFARDQENSVFPKLLIHTRQLANGASNELLDEIAARISDFVREHSINLIVKR